MTDEMSKLPLSRHLDNIELEFKVFQTSSDLPPGPSKDLNLDGYWNQVGDLEDLNGKRKFESLSKLMINCLILSVANVEPERGFSVNKRVLEGRESLEEITMRHFESSSMRLILRKL